MYQSEEGRRALFGQSLDDQSNDDAVTTTVDDNTQQQPSLLQQVLEFFQRCKQTTLRSASMQLDEGGAPRIRTAIPRRNSDGD